MPIIPAVWQEADRSLWVWDPAGLQSESRTATDKTTQRNPAWKVGWEDKELKYAYTLTTIHINWNFIASSLKCSELAILETMEVCGVHAVYFT